MFSNLTAHHERLQYTQACIDADILPALMVGLIKENHKKVTHLSFIIVDNIARDSLISSARLYDSEVWPLIIKLSQSRDCDLLKRKECFNVISGLVASCAE